MSNLSPLNNLHDNRPNRSPLALWHENLRLMFVLFSIGFVASYVLGIIFVEPLNQFYFDGFPVGFWFAQQGSIYVFIILTLMYALAMDRIDRRHGVEIGSAASQSKASSEKSE